MNKKSMKKSLAIVLAMLLVCVISVAGTLAYLQASSGPVTNTFVVGNLFDDDPAVETDGFVLKEHNIVYKGNGDYDLGSTEVTENNYDKLLPGVDVPKDPFVRVKELKEDAYVFIEVVNGLKGGLGATVDTENWMPAVDAEGNALEGKNGVIYVYKENGGKLLGKGVSDKTLEQCTYTVDILTGDKVTVPNTFNAAQDAGQIKFFGYIIQAGGFDNYAAAWEASGFGK